MDSFYLHTVRFKNYELSIINYELKTLSIQLNFKIKKVWKLKKYLSIFRIEITAIAI